MRFSSWTSRAHPTGPGYFTCEAGGYTGYTEIDVCDETIRRLADAKLKRLRDACELDREADGSSNLRIDIVLQPLDGAMGSNPTWGYFIMDCIKRCVINLQKGLNNVLIAGLEPVCSAVSWTGEVNCSAHLVLY